MGMKVIKVVKNFMDILRVFDDHHVLIPRSSEARELHSNSRPHRRSESNSVLLLNLISVTFNFLPCNV